MGLDGKIAAIQKRWPQLIVKTGVPIQKAETGGNQSCQAVVPDDGTLTSPLRLPPALATHGPHMTLTGVRFACGQDAIITALQSRQPIAIQTIAGEPAVKHIITGLNYRCVRDEKGWRVFVSVAVPVTTARLAAAVGTDINADRLALAETDRFSHLVETGRLDLVTYGKTAGQPQVAHRRSFSESPHTRVKRASRWWSSHWFLAGRKRNWRR